MVRVSIEGPPLLDWSLLKGFFYKAEIEFTIAPILLITLEKYKNSKLHCENSLTVLT